MNKLIYILDSDEKICDLLKYTLDSKGYQCQYFTTIESFAEAYKLALPDIVIAETDLPDGNGISAVNKLKTMQPDLWHIAMSNKGDEIDIVRALDSGADDYLVKPLHILEVLARIGVIFRRNIRHSIIQSGDYLIDTDAMTINYRNERLPLTNKEFRLLRLLVEHRGKVMSREKLLTSVWGYEGGETRTLDNHIAHLRKLGVDIETVFGVGYKLKKG